MSAPRIGSLFAGYGGLDMGVAAVTGARTTWFSEIEAAPSKILAHHWPDVPNHGDITRIDFRDVEPVDILTGGFPCQDVSHAGKRAGIAPGTRSGLWSEMHRAIQVLRPRLVVAENVRGLLSADAHSEMEPCPWCVGDGGPGRPLRALGAVLGSLVDIGYDAAWVGLRAADVGAPHGRFRVFVVAWPTEDADGATGGEWRLPAPGQAPGGRPRADTGGRDRAPHFACCDPQGVTFCVGCGDDIKRGRPLPVLPTPRATDGTKGGPGQRGSSGDLMLPSAVTLLPTPMARDHKGSGPADGERHSPNLSAIDALRGRWGDYADAIAHWENLTRPAPAPTEPTGKGGAHRLSPAFVEWLMGLPAGHVTDVPGLSRNDMLKALGNGVVPQQAAAAVDHLLGVISATEVAA